MIDMKKNYRTRDGREVRLYATDGWEERSVHGAIKTKMGWISDSWLPDGRWGDRDEPDDCDLIEVKPRIKRTVWANVYPHNRFYGSYWNSKEDANLYQAPGRIACVQMEIDCEEGEGL